MLRTHLRKVNATLLEQLYTVTGIHVLAELEALEVELPHSVLPIADGKVALCSKEQQHRQVLPSQQSGRGCGRALCQPLLS